MLLKKHPTSLLLLRRADEDQVAAKSCTRGLANEYHEVAVASNQSHEYRHHERA